MNGFLTQLTYDNMTSSHEPEFDEQKLIIQDSVNKILVTCQRKYNLVTCSPHIDHNLITKVSYIYIFMSTRYLYYTAVNLISLIFFMSELFGSVTDP